MCKNFIGKRRAITLAVLTVLSLPVTAQQDDSDIEEVVVTGSFIRGTPLDAPSPVQVVDRASIEAQGAAVIWDVIKNLEINSGSISQEGATNVGGSPSIGDSQLEGTANVNLRNLGENSTLTLINGKRMAPAAGTTGAGQEIVDINAIPIVMTDRIEVLTDGGSALYGADAVAGVVNIIMRTDFEGLEIYGDIQAVEAAGDAFDQTLSGIWGWASDTGDTHFVLSAERFERDPVNILDGNHIDENTEFLAPISTTGNVLGSAEFGANVNPAYTRPGISAQNLADGGSGETIYADPLCESQSGLSGIPFQIGNLRETRGERAGTCFEDVARFTYLSRQSSRNSFAAAFDHTFSEKAEFYSFLNYSESEVVLTGDGLNNTGGSAATRGPVAFLAPPGAYTRNPAFGGNAIGQTTELGYFADRIGLTRPTLADMPNNPLALANGGLNATTLTDVRDNVPRNGRRSNSTDTNSTLIQAGLRGDFELNERDWNYDVSYTWSATSTEQSYQTFNRERTSLAANGLGGPNCTPNGVTDFNFRDATNVPAIPQVPSAWDFVYSPYTQLFFPGYVLMTRESLSQALTSNNHGQGGCQFYNPFLTAFSNPSVANDPEMMDWINETVLRADKRNKLAVFDAVVSGGLWDLAGGEAAFAAGYQRRERNATSRAPAINFPGIPAAILDYEENGPPNQYHYVANNYECSNCIFNFDNTRIVNALFAEVSLPFAEGVETQIALRWEDYGGTIGSELSPKIAASWRPIDELLLRGSWSQSFRAPNIGIVEEGLEAGEVVFRDPISNPQVRAGLIDPTPLNGEVEATYTLGGPAPNVDNETADTFSAGFMWTPSGALDGFSVQADVWRFEVTDRVLPEPAITAVQPEVDLFLAARANPANYILNDSISADSPALDVACDPAALEAQFGRDSAERLNCVVNPLTYVVPGGGISRSARSETANLITLTLAAINAGQIEADGVDVKLAYGWNTDWGQFRISADYTHVRQYKLIDVPGLELGLQDTGILDAAGTSGNGLHVRSLPDNKGNINFNWQRDNHGVTVINRHIGSYQNLAYDAEFETGNDLVRSLLRRSIDSYQTWDIQYRYSHDWGNTNLGSTIFTVGVLDMFDEDLPYLESGGRNYDPTVFDPRGRRSYARMLWRFQ
ncbi:MAG: TonB-dependent receptor [Pseudohongiellaceae bacterium]